MFYYHLWSYSLVHADENRWNASYAYKIIVNDFALSNKLIRII